MVYIGYLNILIMKLEDNESYNLLFEIWGIINTIIAFIHAYYWYKLAKLIIIIKVRQI